MASNSVNIKKLQHAINDKGYGVLYNTSQFYSQQANRPITVYSLRQATYDPQRKRNTYTELFSSTSQLQVLLFLRDLWYEINGWEVPADNEMWNTAKEAYYSNKEKRAHKS